MSKLFFSGAKKRRGRKYEAFVDSAAPGGDGFTCGRAAAKESANESKMTHYHVVAVEEADLLGKNELVLQYVYGQLALTEDCDEFDPEVESVYTLQREVNKEQVMMTLESWEAEIDEAITDRGLAAAASSTTDLSSPSNPDRRPITWESINKKYVEEEKFPDGFLLIYSVTSVKSFERIPEIHSQIMSLAQKHRQIHSLLVPDDESHSVFHPPPMLLVANNVGPIFIRKVTSAQGKAIAAQLGMDYIEACPKSPPMNVSEAFSLLCGMIRKSRHRRGHGDGSKKRKGFGFARSKSSKFLTSHVVADAKTFTTDA